MIESLCVFNISHCIFSIFYLNTRQLGAIRLMDCNGAGKPRTISLFPRIPATESLPFPPLLRRLRQRQGWSRVKKTQEKNANTTI